MFVSSLQSQLPPEKKKKKKKNMLLNRGISDT